ncbi:hypothetical protein ACP70R_014544 [Stipagrostis hirtigluma subsp. patula]
MPRADGVATRRWRGISTGQQLTAGDTHRERRRPRGILARQVGSGGIPTG